MPLQHHVQLYSKKTGSRQLQPHQTDLARIQNSGFDWSTRTDRVTRILQNFRGVEKSFKILTTKVTEPIIENSVNRTYQLLKNLLVNPIYCDIVKDCEECEVTFTQVSVSQSQTAIMRLARWHETAWKKGKEKIMWIRMKVVTAALQHAFPVMVMSYSQLFIRISR